MSFWPKSNLPPSLKDQFNPKGAKKTKIAKKCDKVSTFWKSLHCPNLWYCATTSTYRAWLLRLASLELFLSSLSLFSLLSWALFLELSLFLPLSLELSHSWTLTLKLSLLSFSLELFLFWALSSVLSWTHSWASLELHLELSLELSFQCSLKLSFELSLLSSLFSALLSSLLSSLSLALSRPRISPDSLKFC